MPLRRTYRNSLPRHRNGTAAVECAICLPIVLLLTFATLEFTTALFLKDSLTIAAYEGARVGVQRRTTNKNVTDQVQKIITARRIKNATIVVSPSDITKLKQLEVVTVQVKAPVKNNSIFVGQFLNDRVMTATVKMRREFDE